MKCTKHKIDSFKVYNSVLFCTFTQSGVGQPPDLWSSQTTPHPKSKPPPNQQRLSIFFSPHSLKTTNLCSIPVELPVRDISYTQNYTRCGLLCLASFT